jgi:hypothetical protein
MLKSLLLAFFLFFTHGGARRPNVAICFFGITRSLNHTAPFIYSRLINPIEQYANVRIFLHTFNLSQITNARSREHNVTLHHEEYHLLNPHRFEVTDQEAYLRSLPGNFCQKHGDFFRNRFASVRNVFCQMESLRRVTLLMMSDATKFDVVVYSRPDVLYFNTIDVEQLLLAEENAIYIPMFHRFAGSNDRFAFGRVASMLHYGNRGAQLASYCNARQLHPETFLTHIFRTNNITMKATSIMFSRVRADGLIYENPSWSVNNLPRGRTAKDILAGFRK